VTAEEHNKRLGWLHIGYGGLFVMLVAVFYAVFGPPWFSDPGSKSPFDDTSFATMMSVMFLVNMFFALPSFVAGYGLLKRKRWAKNWGFVAAVFAGMNSPLGLPICAYTVWFLTGDLGKQIYNRPAMQFGSREPEALHGAPASSVWAERNRRGDYTYPSSFEPPNWRGD
jgi:hypothetical protein